MALGFNRTAWFKNVNNCLNTNIYFYLETSSGQSYNLYLNAVHFSTPVLIRHLWQLMRVVLMHWCLICTVPLFKCQHLLLLRDISYNLYLNVVHFSTPVLIRHLWQLKQSNVALFGCFKVFDKLLMNYRV
jgi:uncharacterized membrane protein